MENRKLDEKEWERRYIKRLTDQGLSLVEAQDDFDANDMVDFEDDPEESADEALSYWYD